MTRRIRTHLRTNMVGYVALFFAMAGGTAYALDGTNTVFSDDIVNGEVKSVDILDDGVGSIDVKNRSIKVEDLSNSSVQSGKILDGSVTGDDVADDSLTGADIDESSLAGVGGGVHLMGGYITGFNTSDEYASLTGDSIGGNDTQGSLTPNAAMTLRDFAVELETTPVDNATFTVRINGIPAGISCTITNPNLSCEDLDTVAVAARSRLSLLIQKSDGQNLDVGWYALLD